MDETANLLVTIFIILDASLVQGATAFGFALVAVPLLLPAATAGAIIGMLLLKSFDGPLVKALIALTFLAIALAMLIGRSRSPGAGRAPGQSSRQSPGHALRQTVGAVSGILNGATSMGGPPLALKSLLLAAAVVPGSLAGRALTTRLEPQSFHNLVLASMAVLALVKIALNLAELTA